MFHRALRQTGSAWRLESCALVCRIADEMGLVVSVIGNASFVEVATSSVLAALQTNVFIGFL
jgi:hypothetical protein